MENIIAPRFATILFLLTGCFLFPAQTAHTAAYDNDPGLVWTADPIEEFSGPVARKWTSWFQGTGDREWNIVTGEGGGWAQEVKKSNVKAGIFRENRGFTNGDTFRIRMRARRTAAGSGTPVASIGVHPTGGTDPNGVTWGPGVSLPTVGVWNDVLFDYVATGFIGTVFLRVDFTGVTDSGVALDNVTISLNNAPTTPTRTPKPWMPAGAPPEEPPFVYGMHDPGAEHLFNQKNRKGWVVHALAIGDDPANMTGQRFTEWVDGHGVIARISYGFGHTLPTPDRFDEFAQRCANFVQNSVGCGIWSIANEPGLETAGGTPITPQLYADAYLQCRNAIKAVMPSAQVITCGFVQGNNPFFEETLNLINGQCDGIAIHSYTNSNAWIEANFNLYQGQMALVPPAMRSLPVYMTEAGSGATGPYPDANNGFINLLFQNIHTWNQNPNNQPIRSANFYRWLNSDQWGIESKQGMINDFLTAMDTPYYWRDPFVATPTPTPAGPTGTPTRTPTPGPATNTSTHTPTPASTPVVLNPSFESALSGNWTLWFGSGSNGDALERDFFGSGFPDGTYCLAIKGIGAGGKGAYQYISNNWGSGRNYRLSVRVKNLSNTNLTYSIGYALGNTGSGGGTSATYGSPVAAPSAWTTASVDFTYSGSGGVTVYLRVANTGHSERAGFDLVQITDLGPSGPTSTPTNTPVPANTSTPTRTPTPTNTPSGPLVSEDFNTMPAWDSSFNATWGSAAAWSIVGGGQSGNFLQVSRSTQGSSVRVRRYTIPAGTNITISSYMKCPSFSPAYWMEFAYRFGNFSAQDFDSNPSAWTLIKKFSNTGANGNANAWTQYTSAVIGTGSNTQISIGYKLGSSGGGAPTVGWDTFRINLPGSGSPSPQPSPTAQASMAAIMAPEELVLHHPPASTGATSATGTAILRMDNAPEIQSFVMTATYDPAVLLIASPGDVEMGEFLGSAGASVLPGNLIINNSAGTLEYNAAATGAPFASGGGTLARITWSTKFVAQTTTASILYQVSAANSSGGMSSPATRPMAVTVCYYADLDCDNDVDIIDLQSVAGLWNRNCQSPLYNSTRDIDRDCDIDIGDVQLVAGRWNTQAPFAP